MSLSPNEHAHERALLTRALWCNRIDDHFVSRDLDWRFVLDEARRQAILPTLAHALLHAHNAIPPEIFAELHDGLEQNSAQNALLLDDLVQVTAAFRRAHIHSLVLKGGALLCAYYQSPALRHTDDIDLLIDASKLDAAATILSTLGYRQAPDTPSWHQAPIYESPRGTPLELHFHLPAGKPHGRLDFAKLVARAHGVALRSEQILIPAPADLLGQLCTHVLVHHAKTVSRYLPRHMVDLRAMVAVLGWRNILALAPDPADVLPVLFSLLLYSLMRQQARWTQALLFPSDDGALSIGSVCEQLSGLHTRLFPDRGYIADVVGVAETSARLWPLNLVRLARRVYEIHGPRR